MTLALIRKILTDILPPGTGSAIGGLAVGALVFGLAGPLFEERNVSSKTAFASAETVNSIKTRTNVEPQHAAKLVQGPSGLLLPPRAGAVELTRRIERGVPLKRNLPAKTVERSDSIMSSRPRIALIIDDMGYDRVNSAQAVRLPAAVTLSYLPDAPEVQRQVRRARLRGHPVMLHLPMEAGVHHGRPGRSFLALGQNETTIRSRVAVMLGKFDGYTGVNNHMGSAFTQDRAKLDIVMSELKKRGLFFVDSRTSLRSFGAASAKRFGLPYAVRDVFIDHDPDPRKIRARLAETETIARKTGQAVAIPHPRTATMKALVPWTQELEERGFDLVPVRTLLKKPRNRTLAQLQATE